MLPMQQPGKTMDEMCRHIAKIESELLAVPKANARLKAIAEPDRVAGTRTGMAAS
jgi:hypothetical protein